MGGGSATNSVCSADLTESLSTTPDGHNAEPLELTPTINNQSLSLPRVSTCHAYSPSHIYI